MKVLLAALLLLCFCNSIFEARPQSTWPLSITPRPTRQWGFGEIPGGGAYGVTYESGPWTFGVGGNLKPYGGAGIRFTFK